ncbi:MAG: phage virion morphogenesis protein [Bacteroidales bacterium]
MQTYRQLFYRLIKNIKIELDDEFDRNFERKAFFTTAWPPAKHDTIGSLMMRTAALRKSIRSDIMGSSIRWQSSLPYASIHNEGGKITVTPKMKGFFWYRFRMATGGNNKNLNPEALFWKSMALKPVGSVVTIPKRQFIGDHPIVDRSVREVTNEWVNKDLKAFIDTQLTNMIK